MINQESFAMEMPDVMFDKNLTPYAFRLYFHIKVVCLKNGGVCRETTRTMAAHCRMSMGKVSQTKQELLKAGLISVQRGRKNEVDTISALV